MDASRIHEEITHMLYKVEEQYSRIIGHKGKIPLLEVDLALKDVRDLYECFLDLRAIAEHQRKNAAKPGEKAPESSAAKAPEPAPAASTASPETSPASGKTPEPVPEGPAVSPETSPASGKTPEPAPEVPAVTSEVFPASEKAAEPVKEMSDVSSEEAPEAAKATGPAKDASPSAGSPIAWQKTFDASQSTPPPQVMAPKVDLLKEREKDFVPTVRKIEFKPEPVVPEQKKETIFDKAASLYDKIAKPAEKTVASQASRQPISNIKASIGINEKFSYLKDLFKNNVNEYNEALDKLNDFDSYSDAEDFFQELKAKYSWDPESKSFQGLAELLNRRYLHNA